MNWYIKFMNNWAYQRAGFVQRWRSSRMQVMLKHLDPPRTAQILDLGGTEYLWKLIDHDFSVTLVNLPGQNPEISDADHFRCIEADACELGAIFDDDSFDVVFSNSVIEHVGDQERQQAFADGVRRIGRAYWIQTPSPHFPVEPHTGCFYYWKLPEPVRERLKARWRRRSPEWAQVIEGTRVLSLERMRQLFPDGDVFIERKLGFEKSFALYHQSR